MRPFPPERGSVARGNSALLVRMIPVALLVWLTAATADAFPLALADVHGNTVTLDRPPQRIVSLVPSATEILCGLDAENLLAGITWHSADTKKTEGIPVIGGFFSPSVDHIAALRPDMILVSPLHTDIIARFAETGAMIVPMTTTSIADSFEDIRLLGRIAEKQEAAERIVAENREQLDLVARKIETLPAHEKKRVIRLMGRNRVMTPGSDSFQNEMIRAAGGIAHDFDQNGNIITVDKEAWQRFNPQFIYGCGRDLATAGRLLSQLPWNRVEAVQKGRMYNFPCDLTCRAATHTGEFVGWLAARLYADAFAKPAHQVLQDGVTGKTALPPGLDYVKSAAVVETTFSDFPAKTLVVSFKAPMTVLSSLEGMRDNIHTVANHAFSQPGWALFHDRGHEQMRPAVCQTLGLEEKQCAMLFTGVDMDHLSVQTQAFQQMEVTALVTAGVNSNAQRAGVSNGFYYEPGTINVILMTNRKLSCRAMTRALITITEAKTAALQDLDIRDSVNGARFQATGTGTDNILVVQGRGKPADQAGGHTKMGELIAKAVYNGVTNAVAKQNGIVAGRHVLVRLAEREITVFGLLNEDACDCSMPRHTLAAEAEILLLDPFYAGFMKTAMAVSNTFEKGGMPDIAGFEAFARTVTDRIAGQPVAEIKEMVSADASLPPVLGLAFNALLNGVYHRDRE